MGGAVLESLATRGCKGIFSSHIHHLKYLPIQLESMTCMQMEIAAREGRTSVVGKPRKPTWRIIEGDLGFAGFLLSVSVCPLNYAG